MNSYISNKTLKIGLTLLCIVVVAAIASLFNPNIRNEAFASEGTTYICKNGVNLSLAEVRAEMYAGVITVTINSIDESGKVTATVVNNSDCDFIGSYATYKMFDQKLSTQELFDISATKTIAAHSTAVFTLNIPNCMVQTDFYYGDAPRVLYDDNRFGSITLAWRFFMNNGNGYANASGQFCTHPLTVSCKATPAKVTVGSSVSYEAVVSGGNGTNTYAWTGTDGLTGNAKILTKTYTTEGAKAASVTVTSGTETKTAACGATVESVPVVRNIEVYCAVNKTSVNKDETVSYTATTVGGNGTNTYAWTGTDGLAGTSQNISKAYSTAGAKSATITVTSNGKTDAATCNTTVVVPQSDLIGSCSASAARVRVGENVAWTATAAGGTGTYTYRWTNAQSYFDSTWTTNQTYNTPGIKTNSVAINSGDKTIIQTCSVEVYAEATQLGLAGACTLDDDDIKVGETATWRAAASGGSGSYTYSWSGDNGLDSSNRTVSKSYSSKGIKSASVRISDTNGRSVTANCSLNVREVVKNDDLEVSCKASPSKAAIGDKVTWKATATGGDGDYKYDWSGDHGLAGDDRSESGSYDTAGTKNARVKVTSDDGQTDTARCSMEVEEPQSTITVYTNTDTTPVSQVYLSQVPYTGPMDNLKLGLYILSFFLWTGAISYYILYRKYGNQTLAMVSAKAGAMRDEFSERLSSLRTLHVVAKSPEVKKVEEALVVRNEMLMKLWDRTN